QVTGRGFADVRAYVRELEEDEALRSHVRTCTLEDSHYRDVADPEARYGRRLGWYAMVRCLAPKVVVETGIDKGLGSVVLAEALLRNGSEGRPGRYYGTDSNPKAGFLFREPYAQVGGILFGDSIESLKRLDEQIDLFVNDSSHSAEYEGKEYRAVEHKLTPDAVVIGDNAHVTDELLRFAHRTGRRFLYFQEKPRAHWYPGAGIGVSFPRSVP